MSEAESRECVMVTLRANTRFRYKTSLLVTSLAELRRVVTIAAIRFASIRRGWMTREKILRVIPGLRSGIRAVTCQAR